MVDLPLFDPFKALEEARRSSSPETTRKRPQKLSQEISHGAAKANPEHCQEVEPTFAAFATFAGRPSADVLACAPVQKEEEEKIQSFHILTRGWRGVREPPAVDATSTPAKVAKAAKVELSHSDIGETLEIGPAKVSDVDLRKWFDALNGMSPDVVPCPDYRLAEWSRVHSRALAFLTAFGPQAVALGWTAPRLFGVHHEAGIVRVDACGALILPSSGTVRAITATEISFGHLTHRTIPGQIKGPPVWEFGR